MYKTVVFPRARRASIFVGMPFLAQTASIYLSLPTYLPTYPPTYIRSYVLFLREVHPCRPSTRRARGKHAGEQET